MKDQIILFGQLPTDNEYCIHQRKHGVDYDTTKKSNKFFILGHINNVEKREWFQKNNH